MEAFLSISRELAVAKQQLSSLVVDCKIMIPTETDKSHSGLFPLQRTMRPRPSRSTVATASIALNQLDLA